MEAENLPTFNSNAIEVNLHKIPDLSDKFVYFNDDFFILRKTEPSHFFRRGLPAGVASLNAFSPVSDDTFHYSANCVSAVNRNFDKRATLRRHFSKWFNPRYGSHLFRTIALSPWPRFTGFAQLHLPQPFLRSTFEEVWEREPQALTETAKSRLRSLSNVSQYVFQYWQLCSGQFTPVSPRRYGRYWEIGRDAFADILKGIVSQEDSLVCINDGPVESFADAKRDLQAAFLTLFPSHSKFELQS